MKKLIPLLFATACTTFLFSQDFPGYRSGNYTGVNSVFFNPANIADSRYRFDFNLLSASTIVANNQSSFSLKNKDGSFNVDSIQRRLFNGQAGTSNGFTSADVHGPSLMFNTGRKMAIAFTTRARVMANTTDINGDLVNKLQDDYQAGSGSPFTVSGSNMQFSANAWTEYGFSAARVLKDQGKHFFKAGLTLKYLSGASNQHLEISGLNATITDDRGARDNYVSNASGRIATRFSGISLDDFEISQVTESAAKGFGADIGFVYEYRPEFEKYKSEDGKGWKKGHNKYKWKISLALLDLGSIRYDIDPMRSGTYNVGVSSGQGLYLNGLNGLGIENYKAYFDSSSRFFTRDNSNRETTYKVALPATLHLNADYHLHKGFYLNLASQFSLKKGGDITPASRYYTSITFTPRYEGKGLGLYVPITYNSLTKLNAGASLSLGPLFFGSGSILNALTGNSKQTDVFVGLRFGGLR